MRTLKVLVQTTTPARPDNWTVDSFLLLREHLASLQEMDTRFEVTARNRDAPIDAPAEAPPEAGAIRVEDSSMR